MSSPVTENDDIKIAVWLVLVRVSTELSIIVHDIAGLPTYE